jgi:hypothetical protein
MTRDNTFISSIRLPGPEGVALIDYAKRDNDGNVDRTVRQAVQLLLANEIADKVLERIKPLGPGSVTTRTL